MVWKCQRSLPVAISSATTEDEYLSEASVRYIAAARYDDRIRVETRLSRVTSRTMIFDYTILNADTLQRLATASTTLISLDASNRVSVLPADVRRTLAGEGE